MHALLKGALALGFIAATALPAAAQTSGGGLFGGQDDKDEKDEIEGTGQKGAVVPDSWGKHLEKIETHTRRLGQLSTVLGSASDELAKDFDQYLEDPQNELLASRIEKKMAIFADQVVQEFDYVISDQDVILANFKELRLQLETYDDTIEDKLITYGKKLDGLRKVAADSEQGLIGLAIKVKETTDPKEKKKAQMEFARQYRRHRLKARYVRGLERNLHNYQVLVENVHLLTGLFSQLQDKFGALIEHLEMEKEYLCEAIELQAESVKIKKIMSEGILHGEKSIKNVTERLAMLYARVDAFTEVHDKLNMGLGGFFETQETLHELSAKIDQIGEGSSTGPDAPTSITDAVDHFYGRRGEYRPSQDPAAKQD